MIDLVKNEECCGCTACISVCPVQCIELLEDEEGFWYPRVQKEKCVACGKCNTVCPILNVKRETSFNRTSYIAYNKNMSIRCQSSSGGIFSLLAEKILDEDGIVFGATYDENFQVHHIAIEQKSDLQKLRGSKYLQSRIEQTYEDVRKYLAKGKKVLYSGTACQIAGLKLYLQKDYETLYTVDILCHGVPSPKVWDRYLDEMKHKYHSNISDINFRDKKMGWKTFSLRISFDNQEYSELFHKDSYMKLFLRNICLRPSCHACKYKEIQRPSDLTIGDSWGIEKYAPEMDDNQGTSVIIVQSQKGNFLMNEIRSDLEIREEEVDKILPQTADSRKSVLPHPNRTKFFRKMNNGATIDELVDLLPLSFYQKVKKRLDKLITSR